MLNPDDILGPGQRISKRLERYEARPQQLEMADAVASAIRDEVNLVIEAGTGVGKSFAYLVPAILAATENEATPEEDEGETQRIVVSTHTISLQEQLLSKDLPLLNAVIPREFSAVLVKGRRNFISLRRLQTAVQRASTTFNQDEEIDQLHYINQWAKNTNDGSQSDLDMRPLGKVWDEVASDSGNCMGRNCEFHGDCFYYKARRRASHAQIIVVNHALFFSDLALRKLGVKLIPDYHTVIFDEAHTVESVAAHHSRISRLSSVTSRPARHVLPVVVLFFFK